MVKQYYYQILFFLGPFLTVPLYATEYKSQEEEQYTSTNSLDEYGDITFIEIGKDKVDVKKILKREKDVPLKEYDVLNNNYHDLKIRYNDLKKEKSMFQKECDKLKQDNSVLRKRLENKITELFLEFQIRNNEELIKIGEELIKSNKELNDLKKEKNELEEKYDELEAKQNILNQKLAKIGNITKRLHSTDYNIGGGYKVEVKGLREAIEDIKKVTDGKK